MYGFFVVGHGMRTEKGLVVPHNNLISPTQPPLTLDNTTHVLAHALLIRVYESNVDVY